MLEMDIHVISTNAGGAAYVSWSAHAKHATAAQVSRFMFLILFACFAEADSLFR
jgi:hypothetical protein